MSSAAEPAIDRPVVAVASVDRLDLTVDHLAVRSTIAVVTGLAMLAVATAHRADPVLAVLLSIVVLSYGALATIDAAQQRLPNRITLPLAAATVAAVLAGGVVRSDLTGAFAAIGVGLGLAVLLIVLRFGMGDAKLALTVGTIAAWLGSEAMAATAYGSAFSGGAVALALIVVHRRRDVSFGFGPFLAIGSVAGMLVGAL